MDIKMIRMITGALLHDLGKVLYRYNDGRDHSIAGYEWVKENGFNDDIILQQIRYHHGKHMKDAKLPDDSPAYITYLADNIAAGADRRAADDASAGMQFSKTLALSSIFNLLNGNHEKFVYPVGIMSDEGQINYPVDSDIVIDETVYGKIVDNIKDAVRGIELKEEYIHSLLEVLEANLTYIPSSTDKNQVADISLFDHVKITAALASCILIYLEQMGTSDFRRVLFKNGKEFYKEQTFLLCSIDLSGIQNFIYTTASTKALKNLRARSFYLEIIMEHIADQMLTKLGLSRANLLYTGGGHGYFLLPNTERCRNTISAFEAGLNQWLRETFDIALYAAVGYSPCSANQLMNIPQGSYSEIFKSVSEILSQKKSCRYDYREILSMNSREIQEHQRECKVCGRSDLLVTEDKCEICNALESLSNDIMEKEFVVILSKKPDEDAVVLPGDAYMVMKDRSQLIDCMKNDDAYLRSYGKNKMFTEMRVATKLWVGDYSSAKEFTELAQSAEGIQRLGVLRADVDNLGQAFVGGFDDRHLSISRTTTFSRKLSAFFKLHINNILNNPRFFIGENIHTKRNALIVYSGGDDVFLIGAWDDVIGFAIDLHDSLKRYSQNTLTVSAGIGIFPGKYPVSAMAYETGLLEDCSKNVDGKNAVTLFNQDNAYSWDDLKEKVVGEKLRLLQKYFQYNPEKGNSMLYKLLEYIRHKEDKINLARFAYLLARIEPEQQAKDEQKELYQEFAKKMYRWIQNEEDSKQLVTAIYLYVYLNRERKEG